MDTFFTIYDFVDVVSILKCGLDICLSLVLNRKIYRDRQRSLMGFNLVSILLIYDYLQHRIMCI